MYSLRSAGWAALGSGKMRNRNTNNRGGAWTHAEVIAVWNKGRVIAGQDPRVRRKDVCGAWITFAQYGQTTSGGEGWEIDHIRPVVSGGYDSLDNLQPLQWENNRSKGDNWPNWGCATSARA